MLERIYLNREWSFSKEGDKPITVNLPHNVFDVTFNYVNDEDYQFVSTYQKVINIDKKYAKKHLFLTFEGVCLRSEIYLNDELLLEHMGAYDAFEVDLKDKIKLGEDNVIKVVVDSREDSRIPPFGGVVDYLAFGGIYRDVYLDVCDETYVKDAFVKPFHELNKWGVDIEVTLAKLHPYNLAIYFKDEEVYSKDYSPSTVRHEQRIFIDKPNLWDVDNPNLYKLVITLKEDEVIDKYETLFGIRTCVFKVDGFYLNDKKVKVLGLNRHQSYPYIGYAAPKRLQELDAQILRNELCVNAVRTSHYPQSQHFINECDKLGLMVFIEIPGWQHIGDKAWQALEIEYTRKMVLQYRNHPSIILWGVRIDESKDNHDFYYETNKIAHELDPTRQTGGVRCFKKMELLEDVYTYNDFISFNEPFGMTAKHKIVKVQDLNKPYLISEYNGHLYPTKIFDGEERRIGQALRISKGMEDFYKRGDISAFFNWCMLDYYTHKDFGSGDKVCYHGVMDMFRNPKTSSYVYSSQGKNDFLAVSTLYNPGDHENSIITGMYVYTSADEIKLYKNGEYIRSFNHSDSPYKYIPTAPILIEDFVGNQLVDKEGYTKKESEMMKKVLIATVKYGSKMPIADKLRYLRLMLFHHVNYQTGYDLYGKYIGNWGSKETTYSLEAIKDGKVVNSINLEKFKVGHVSINTPSLELHEENTYDMTLVRLSARDQHENVMEYYNEPIEVSANGSIEIVGPSIISFKGGFAGLYVKTKGKLGKGTLSIKSPLGNTSVVFEVK